MFLPLAQGQKHPPIWYKAYHTRYMQQLNFEYNEIKQAKFSSILKLQFNTQTSVQ